MLYTFRIIVFLELLTPILSFSQDSLWTQKADIPTARWHLSSVVVYDKIYAIGGVNGYTSMEEYDPVTNQWDIKEPMPTGRSFIGTGVVDGKIYVIGGSILFQAALTTVEMYDPADNSWTSKASLPSGREGIGSSVVDGKIYVIGGNNPSESTVEMYDPQTNTWTVNLANMPTARWEPECVSVYGKIYAVGGFLSSSTGAGSDAVEMYDPQTDEWTIKASLPYPRGGGSVAALNGMIYYFGGSSSHGAHMDDIWIYDPFLDEWNGSGELPFAWAMMGAAVVDSTIYLMAGSKIVWPHNDNFHGQYSYKPPNITTNIEKNNMVNNYPEVISLDQNYPNPFYPKTLISYYLAKSTYIELSIHNKIGQKVTTLYSGKQLAGKYEMEWDAQNFINGVYFYKIATGNITLIKKAILLK